VKCPECKVENAADHNYCKHCGFPLQAHAVERDLRVGSVEKALDRCLLVVQHNPDSPQTYFNLGQAYYHLGRLDEAIEAFRHAVDLDDTLAHAHFQLAVTYYRRGRFAER
jgi:tetratricopeptide (TPR) repeat protein